MTELWRSSATIRSGMLLIDQNHEIVLHSEPADQTELQFGMPKKVEIDHWVNWEHIIPINMWDYEVLFTFPSSSVTEAVEIARKKLEQVATLLSYIGTAPARIESYGSVTNSPEDPVPGQQYKTIALSFEQALEAEYQPKLGIEQIDFLTKLFLSDSLTVNGEERIMRSMRWLQQSYFAYSPVEEFMSVMFAFEAISHLIKPSGPFYWHCASCDRDIEKCPYCGHSTEWGGSGKIGMEWFVTEHLKKDPKIWKDIWRLRNKILHGSQDITQREQQKIVGFLPTMEETVILALRFLLQFPSGFPPSSLRQRIGMYGAQLHIEWTAN